MSDLLTDSQFNEFRKLIYDSSGITFSETNRSILDSRLKERLRDKNLDSLEAYYKLITSDKEEFKLFLDSITTNLTRFFRNQPHFDALINYVIPHVIENKKKTGDTKIRIWSAGCSTGEEPYTLAMLCMDFLGLEMSQWDTTILATDIDTKVLETAVRGVYPKNSVEQLPQQYVRRFFRPVSGEQYQVKDELKKQVLFRRFNLMHQLPFRKPLHVVFIRNVMIYFDEPTKEKLLENIYEKMAPGGYLFIGSTESISQSNTGFRYVRPSIYRK